MVRASESARRHVHRVRIPTWHSFPIARSMPASIAAMLGNQVFMATAKVLAQRLAALNKETFSIMARLEKSKSEVRAEDELSDFDADC